MFFVFPPQHRHSRSLFTDIPTPKQLSLVKVSPLRYHYRRTLFSTHPPYLRDVIFFRSSLPRWQLAVAKISWLTFQAVSASLTELSASSVHTRSQRAPKARHRNNFLTAPVTKKKKVSRPRPGDFKASRLLDVTKHATKQRVWRFYYPVRPFSLTLRLPI